MRPWIIINLQSLSFVYICIQDREIILPHTARDQNVVYCISLCNTLLVMATYGLTLF